MPETDDHQNGPDTATATLEPPPPGAPPTTGTAEAPKPKGGRWIVWVIAVVVLALLAAGVVGVIVISLARHSRGSASNPSQATAAFDSAMKKAGVTATAPAAPVQLTSVKAAGSHPFDASFTADEITALVNAFPYSTTVSGQELAVSSASIEIPGDGSVTLSGTITLNGNSYNGSITGPVAFENGQITSTGATGGSAEGFTLGGSQAQQATTMLLDYLNSYLAAAPGLKVESAQLSGTTIHVKGTAPDSITTQ